MSSPWPPPDPAALNQRAVIADAPGSTIHGWMHVGKGVASVLGILLLCAVALVAAFVALFAGACSNDHLLAAFIMAGATALAIPVRLLLRVVRQFSVLIITGMYLLVWITGGLVLLGWLSVIPGGDETGCFGAAVRL